jgi:hypothetical protein
MTMKRERWLRGTCPASDPEQTGVRRRYEAERQNVRLARFYARDDPSWGCASWARMEDAARSAIEQLEGENRCLAGWPLAVLCDGLGLESLDAGQVL